MKKWKPIPEDKLQDIIKPKTDRKSRKKPQDRKYHTPETFFEEIVEIFPDTIFATGVLDDFKNILPKNNETVFITPSSNNTAKFMEAAARHEEKLSSNSTARTILLVTVRTDAISWHLHAFDKAWVVFLRGPMYFENSDKGMPAALLIYGPLCRNEKEKISKLGYLINNECF